MVDWRSTMHPLETEYQPDGRPAPNRWTGYPFTHRGDDGAEDLVLSVDCSQAPPGPAGWGGRLPPGCSHERRTGCRLTHCLFFC